MLHVGADHRHAEAADDDAEEDDELRADVVVVADDEFRAVPERDAVDGKHGKVEEAVREAGIRGFLDSEILRIEKRLAVSRVLEFLAVESGYSLDRAENFFGDAASFGVVVELFFRRIRGGDHEDVAGQRENGQRGETDEAEFPAEDHGDDQAADELEGGLDAHANFVGDAGLDLLHVLEHARVQLARVLRVEIADVLTNNRGKICGSFLKSEN